MHHHSLPTKIELADLYPSLLIPLFHLLFYDGVCGETPDLIIQRSYHGHWVHCFCFFCLDFGDEIQHAIPSVFPARPCIFFPAFDPIEVDNSLINDFIATFNGFTMILYID